MIYNLLYFIFLDHLNRYFKKRKMRHIPNLKYQKCCACKESLRSKTANNIRRIGEISIKRIREFFQNRSIQLNDFICRKCIS